MPAFRNEHGSVVFAERRHLGGSVASLLLPCGQCIGCRLERSRMWAVRCLHECSMHSSNCFITLTYRREVVPSGLQYRDFQLFMKRLRRRFFSPVRFYMCGEYGELDDGNIDFDHPHFHALLFGFDFPDKVLFKTVRGNKLYRSPLLEELWPYGFSSIGDANFETAAYVARYCMKKVTGDRADSYYVHPDTGEVMLPEFNHMSLKPGIGAGWIDKWTSDVYPSGMVVVNGVETMPPKYYDKRVFKSDPLTMEQVYFEREVEGRSRFLDSTDERLKVREQVAHARVKSLKRPLRGN